MGTNQSEPQSASAQPQVQTSPAPVQQAQPQQVQTPPAPIQQANPQEAYKEEQEELAIEEAKKKGDILQVSASEKYMTVNELFEKSQSNSIYYTLLILSVFIVSSGLLLENAPIVIGGMLVTPMLTPILLIALSITVGELKSIKVPGILLLKSVFVAVGISAVLTLVFGVESIEEVLPNTIRTALLYFVVAVCSGIAAAFAWVRKQVAEILPGIAIAVSLVPPLCLVGVNMGLLSLDAVRFYGVVFTLNLLGIVVGSMMVFSLLKFYKHDAKVKEKVEEMERLEEAKKAKKIAEKAEEKIAEVKKNIAEVKKIEEKKKEGKE